MGRSWGTRLHGAIALRLRETVSALSGSDQTIGRQTFLSLLADGVQQPAGHFAACLGIDPAALRLAAGRLHAG